MASTYTTRIRLEKQGDGENANSWGLRLNQNVIDLVDEAVAGYKTIDVTGATSISLTTGNGTDDEARNFGLNFVGTLTADCTVNIPAVEKIYFVNNKTTGDYNVLMKPTGGTAVTVARAMIAATTGTTIDTLNSFAQDSIIGTVSINGDLNVTGTVSATNVTATNVRAVNVTATNIRGTTVSATNVRAANVTATNIRGTTVSATNVRSDSVTATNIRGVTISATNIKAIYNVCATSVVATNIKATNISATTVSATNLRATNVTATNIKALSNVTATNIFATSIQSERANVSLVSCITLRAINISATGKAHLDGGAFITTLSATNISSFNDANIRGTLSATNAVIPGTLSVVNTFTRTLKVSSVSVVGENSSSAPILSFRNTDISTSAGSEILALNFSDSTVSNNATYISFESGSSRTVNGKIDSNGSGGIDYDTSSDERLKENIVNAPSQWETIKNINVRSYDWKSSGVNNIGFIAQELNQHIPQCVSEGGDDVNRNPWLIDYSKLTPFLAKALQEAIEKIENLEERLSNVEENN